MLLTIWFIADRGVCILIYRNLNCRVYIGISRNGFDSRQFYGFPPTLYKGYSAPDIYFCTRVQILLDNDLMLWYIRS